MPLHVSFFRRAIALCALALALTVPRPGFAQSPPTSTQPTLPPGYIAQVLPPIQRATFQHRSAFGSLCSLAPLACALIDRPFALNAKLELFIRPKAPDGTTSLLLPFAVSVPILGRAEVGVGSCFTMAWASSDKSSPASSLLAQTPTGLCPMWVAAKGVLFPLFRDPHRHPALAAEYLVEYQAGPFVGLNQLGLPGPLSKISAMYRHPLGDLELSGAATVLLDHISRAGTLQIGAHAGYRVPFGEHLWIFAQAILQMPSWGPVLLDAELVNKVDLSPPVAGTLAIGAQQRADFGFGVGLTVMLTKSDLETRVDLLFRLLSFEVGPHIKPLFPPKPKPEPASKVDVALQLQGASALCPPGMQPAPAAITAPGAPQPTDAVQCVPIPTQPRQCPPGLVPAPPPSRECVMPRLAPPSPLWGHPCEFVPFDGSPHLRVGRIDRSGEYCEWDGLRLPLGAIIAPPQPGRANTASLPPSAPLQPVGPISPPTAAPILRAQNPPFAREGGLGGKPIFEGHSDSSLHPSQRKGEPERETTLGFPSLNPMAAPAAPPRQAAQKHEPAGDHYDQQAASVPGSPLASGFVDRGKKAAEHVGQLARVVRDHGLGAVVPSKEDIKTWASDFKHQCLEHMKDCLEKKAHEAADELNEFRKKSPDDKLYTVGGWGFDAAASAAASAVVPGAGAVFGGVVRTGEKAVGKALVKKAGKEAIEEIAEHTDEAAAKRLLIEAEDRAAKEAAERAGQSAAGQVGATQLAPYDPAFAAQQILGHPPVTPGGRVLTPHAAERMAKPPSGRSPMSVHEVDEVLDRGTRIRKVSPHPQGATVTVQHPGMPGKPQVVVDAATGKRVITVIKND
ncbi:hypothetical protein [Haliangium sp. UPWRP_2]|uniref:hypothetical protein n=1 Tax=Haliangium sp. UPWRP_2 TaxID=1931276 RepID=UPI000B5452F6|nr:hypothetical protein [Haliangium sp. UPWRP_2]